MSWHQYATSEKVDQGIQGLIKTFGVFYLIVLAGLYGAFKKNIWGLRILFMGGVSLVLLYLLVWAEKFFYLAMLLEHSLQMVTPFLAYYLWSKGEFLTPKVTMNSEQIIKVASALTFIGHGLFAMGVYPVPGHFIDMLINVFGCSEEVARYFLKFVGSLDLLAAIGLFFKPTIKWSLYFMVAWGGITAMARITAHLDFNLLSLTSQQWVYETLVRVPHALIPLFLLAKIQQSYSQNRV